MKRILAICLLLLMPALRAQEQLDLDAQAWLEDLEYLSNTIREKHKNPFHHTPETEFETRVDFLRKRIPDLPDRQVVVELTRLAAMIGDGHTAIRPYKGFRTYPITFYWYSDTLRVHHLGETHQDLLGYRVTAINKVPVSEVYEAVRVMTPQGENEYYTRNWSQFWMRNADVLYHLGITPTEMAATYTLKDDSGKETTLLLEAMAESQYTDYPWRFVFEHPPAFMSSPEPIRYSYEEEHQGLYIQFNSYPEWKDMRVISREIGGLARSEPIRKLVVDFRQNGGGDFNKGLHLIRQLEKSDVQKRARVYVLTNRSTFSAAMSNAAHFRDMLGAILVGEPPAQRPNGYSETGSFTLPNSGIKGSCSIRYYVFQDEDTDEMKLHHRIEPSFKAFLRGEDPVLQWVWKQ